MVKEKSKMKKLAALFTVILLIAAFTCLSAFAEGNEAKIGETEYATLDAALGAAKDDDTVTLLKDVTYDVSGAYRTGIIDGGNHTLTLKKRILTKPTNLTLKNINVDLSQFNDTASDAFVSYEGTLTFEDGVNITGAANNLSYVARVSGASAAFNMTGGSITNCSVKEAVVCVENSANATISGGSIKDNIIPNVRGAVYLNGGTLTISGDTEVLNNLYNNATLFNVNIISGTFNVEAPFTGKIGVRLNNGGSEGTVIGNAVGDLTLLEDSIVRDGTPELIGRVSDGKVVLAKKQGEAKIGGTEYATLAEALDAAGAGDTVTLLKDVTYDGDGSTFRKGIIDGDNHKLTLKNRILVATLTLKNITVDLSQFSGEKTEAFAVFGTGTLTFEDGADIIGAANNLSYVIRVADTAAFNMTGGSITNCSVNHSVVYVTGSANATISGGSIKDNAVLDMRGAVYLEGGTLTISGNAEILGNFAVNSNGVNVPFNVNIISGTFNVDAPFTGKIGVRLNNGGAAGTEIGNAGAGLTLSADSIVRDGTPELIGRVSDGKLILTKKLTLSATTDQGKYTKAGGATVYGVVRVNTTVTEVVDKSLVEEMGTYFYVENAENTEKTEKRSVTVTPSVEKFVEGNGYMADVYGITDSTATVYAVNFYKLKGIDGYVFSDPISVTYDANTAKSVEYTE